MKTMKTMTLHHLHCFHFIASLRHGRKPLEATPPFGAPEKLSTKEETCNELVLSEIRAH